MARRGLTRDYLLERKIAGLKQFDDAIRLLSAAVGSGPEAAKGELKAQFEELKKSRNDFVTQIDKQVAAL